MVALDELSLHVPAGTVTVLLGPNGAGRTTAVRMITGALPPEAGTVRVFGLDFGEDGEAVRRRCGVVSANSALYDRLSGYDNLRYSADPHGLGPAAPIEAAAARLGIDGALGLRVAGYSTGMKTRLALARAILHDPGPAAPRRAPRRASIPSRPTPSCASSTRWRPVGRQS